MATTIKLKNGSGAPLAGDLVQGEPALDLTNKRLYTEDSGGTVIEVGTSPSTIDINAGTIDGTVIGGSSAAAGTFTTFTSTGIDDNATSTAITIDSSENVGIGTSTITDFSGQVLQIHAASGSASRIKLTTATSGTATSDGASVVFDTSNIFALLNREAGALTLGTSALERMRIDSSGNVLIGDTGQIGTEKLQVSITSGGTAYSTTSMQSSALAWLNNAENDLTKASTLVLRQFNAASAISGLYTGTQNAALTFGTSSSGSSGNVVERMRIDSSGNVGIGTNSPDASLSVNGKITLRASDYVFGRISTNNINSTQGGLTFEYVNSGYQEAMRIDFSGLLQIATTGKTGRINLQPNPSNNHFVEFYNTADVKCGEINTATGTQTNYVTSSDARLKENIVDAPAGNIDAIRVRSFDWKTDGSHQTYGMVAQELAEVAPEAVSQGATDDDMWGVDYSKLVPMMIKEIQDLKAKVKELESR